MPFCRVWFVEHTVHVLWLLEFGQSPRGAVHNTRLESCSFRFCLKEYLAMRVFILINRVTLDLHNVHLWRSARSSQGWFSGFHSSLYSMAFDCCLWLQVTFILNKDDNHPKDDK